MSRGEYTINGLRNRNVRRQLWPKAGNGRTERRQAGAVTRQLRLLRAHGLLRKVSGTLRYVVTEGGRKIITALLAAPGGCRTTHGTCRVTKSSLKETMLSDSTAEAEPQLNQTIEPNSILHHFINPL